MGADSVLHSFHRGVGNGVKKFFAALDIFICCSRITNGSVLCGSAVTEQGFTVGSEVLQRTDPIVRRLISTG